MRLSRPAHSSCAVARDSRAALVPGTRRASRERPTRAAALHWAAASSARRCADRRNRIRACAGPASASLRADARQIVMHRVIARQHQMIAIVDHLVRAPDRNRSGSARPPAARLRSASTVRAARRQRGGRRQAGKARADDIRPCRLHPNKPVAQHQRQQPRLAAATTRWRGGAKPCASLRAQDFANRPRPSGAASRCGPWAAPPGCAAASS